MAKGKIGLAAKPLTHTKNVPFVTANYRSFVTIYHLSTL